MFSPKIWAAGVAILLFTLCNSLLADDQIILIQAVSTSGKTFAINRGYTEGLGVGQESLFTNKSISVVARAVEVARSFSVWELRERKGAVPFIKNDAVVFSNNIDSIWINIPDVIAKYKRREFIFKSHNFWIARGDYSTSLNESTSETTAEQVTSRKGFQLEGLFNHQFRHDADFGVGLRYDWENSTIKKPNLEIPTERLLAIAEITYHFAPFKGTDHNMYFGTGLAYGRSTTRVFDQLSSGTALILPIVRVGFLHRNQSHYAMMYEIVGESISTKETFENTVTQTTNVINVKLAIAIKF